MGATRCGMPESAPRNELVLIDPASGAASSDPSSSSRSTKAASTSQMGRFETEWLAEANLAALADPTPRTFFEVAAHPSVMTLSLRVFLRTPHATMPDLMLTPDETDDIISYILT